MYKQGRQVMMRGRGQHKECKTWIHQQNFVGGEDGLIGAEKIMALDGG